MRAARSEVYKAQEQIYKELQEKETAQIAEVRQRADAAIKAAKADIARDVETAKASLGLQSDALAAQIAESILRRSAA